MKETGTEALLPACGIDYLNLQALLMPANCPQSLEKKNRKYAFAI